MFKDLRRKILKWRRRREYNRLTPEWQTLIKIAGQDPDSLEEKEEAGITPTSERNWLRELI